MLIPGPETVDTDTGEFTQSCGDVVQVQQIGRIALTASAFGVAAVKGAIGQQISRGDDAPPGQCLPELL